MSFNNQGQYIPQLSYGPTPEPAGAQPAQQSNTNIIIIVFLLLTAAGLAVALGYIYVKKTNCPEAKKCPEAKVCPICPTTAATPDALTTMHQDINHGKVVKQFQESGSFIVGNDDNLQNTAIVIVGNFMRTNNLTGYGMAAPPANYYAVLTAPTNEIAIKLVKSLFPKV